MTRIKAAAGIAFGTFLMLAVTASPARATSILVFGQTSALNTVSIVENLALSQTTISATDVAISITQMENVLGSTPAFFDFSATSVGAATTIAGNVFQVFSGTWSICSTAVGCGINYLSGAFAGGFLGNSVSGTLGASTPPAGQVTFTENGPITSVDIQRGISLSFNNWTPGMSIVGTSLSSGTASVSGTFSAEATPEVPEPASMILLGTGLLGIGGAIRRRRAAARA